MLAHNAKNYDKTDSKTSENGLDALTKIFRLESKILPGKNSTKTCQKPKLMLHVLAIKKRRKQY